MKRKNWLYTLLLPPVFGYIVSIHYLFKQKTTNWLYQYGFLFCLLGAYCYPTYDTCGRLIDIEREFKSMFDGDVITNIIRLLNDFIDSYYCFFALWLICFFLFCKAIKRNTNEKKAISITTIIACIFGINICNLFSLTYFTFAAVFCLYAFEKYNSKFLIYIPLFFIAYCIHPGVFLILPFAIILNELLKRDLKIIAILYVAVYYVFTKLVLSGAIPALLELLDANNLSNISNSYLAYTSENSQWGANMIDYGIKGDIWYLLNWTFFAIISILLLKNINKIKNHFATSVFVIGVVCLINVWGFQTFTERITIFTFLAGLITAATLSVHKLINRKLTYAIYGVVTTLFFLTFLVYPQPNNHLFKNVMKGEEVSLRTTYTPSIALAIGINPLGYDDDFWKENISDMYGQKRTIR